MKRSIGAVLGSVLGLALAGCSALSPVPKTFMVMTLDGHTLKIQDPKQTTLTNLQFTISTNGTCMLSVGYWRSDNSSNIIQSSYAGETLLIHEIGTQLQTAAQMGATMAGSAAGAAIKTP